MAFLFLTVKISIFKLFFRELCLLLSPKEIFQLFAANLAVEKNLPFARQLVSILNLILISAPELRHVRTELKDLSTKVNG